MRRSSSAVRAKVIFVGDPAVGKTSIIDRAPDGETHSPLDGKATVQGLSHPTLLKTNTCSAYLDIWDTPGQQRFREMVSQYAHNTKIAVLVYSVIDRQTFQSLPDWWGRLHSEWNIPHVILVGNKVDLERTVSSDEGQEFANSHSTNDEQGHSCPVQFLETSATTNQGIQELYDNIVELAQNLTVETIGQIDLDVPSAGGPQSEGCSC
jgi:small GTP-binding protein